MMNILSPTEDEKINTTGRWNHYCRKKRKSTGAICSLYSPHESPQHVSGHGKERWDDDECES